MKTKHLQKLALAIILAFSCYVVHAQTRPSSDNNTQQSLLCIGCSINNTSNARDGSSTTFTTFDVTGLPASVIAFLSRDYSFSANLPIEDEITIDFQFSDNSLLASLGANVASAVIFDRLKIELLDGNTSIAEYGGNGLLSNLAEVDVLNSATGSFHVIIKVPTSNVNKIRITTGALVSLGAGVSPSNLLVSDIRSSMTDRYYASRFTGNSGQVGAALLACISCEVAQEALAATYLSDPNFSFANYKWDIGLSLLGSEYQFSEYDWGSSPNQNFLGDQDGIADAVVVTLQEASIADVGLSDLGLNLWSSGGIELVASYTDLTSATYTNSSSLLTATALGSNSGRFNMTFDIPLGKTIDRVEVRRVAPSVGLFTEVRLFSIHTVPVNTLPLELGTFKAVKKDNLAELNWTTIQEKDIAYFEIQRSTDAIDFEPIAEKSTNNNSLNRNYYTFTDANPLPTNNYYRLKVIDYNEAISYSAIKTIDFTSTENNYLIYTNQNQLCIKNNTTTMGDVEITIVSIDGKVLKQLVQKEGSYSTIIDSQSFGQVFVINIKHQEGQFTRLIRNL